MNVNTYEPSESTQQSRKEITSIQVSRHHKELKDGIVGLKNNSLYCYMNACLQCLLPITELRDYYLN
jgi:ubiquitin C-terminal hydrolase